MSKKGVIVVGAVVALNTTTTLPTIANMTIVTSTPTH
jgi:hypothetical protein